MRLLVLGATGRTGRRVVAVALKRGHQVTAIVRRPEAIADLPVEVVQGTPYAADTVARAMVGCDAVVNVVNVSRTSDNPWARLTAPPDLISKACANALRAMEPLGVQRYVALSTVGAGESWGSLPFPVRWMVQSSNLRVGFDDHTAQEALLVASRVDYTVARAPLLTNREDASGVRVVQPGERMASAVSRQSVAEFLVSIVERGEYIRQIVHISDRA